MSIVVKNLLKVYGTQKAVNNISFSIEKGEIVGFLGPNGAGKSTTMKIITGYLTQDGGSVAVCGLDAGANPVDIKRKTGYLPEANPLYHDMFVKEYLLFVAGVYHIKNSAAAVNEMIGLVGLTPEKHKKIGQLSKGYKQRVGLAAALIHDPEVLILDEPTSGLDPNQIVEIRNVIKEQGKNKTVLFSSHILQEVQAICDRVIIINKGELVADDSLQHLLHTKQTNEVKLVVAKKAEASVFAHIPNSRQIDELTWQFSTTNTEQLKRQLMETALRENINIVSLSSEAGNNLEQIFRSLTH
ncbi:MAG TPA: gliding motility-associated ABC transporter ATP-binding subunit GldA [Panacibacter sp.]|nr:gliding motility-associated ABC transporter ATP-binding subunit GldA [Panacibacter sp.]HNP42646.1 gliding motility-associated ABC transporter ATP-binding subunit GldA [Panacibacter sp.]